MKVISAILFLIILLIQVAGFHFFFQYNQRQIKTSVNEILKQHLPNINDTVFSFPVQSAEGFLNNISWTDENEFTLNGALYDVIDKKIENGLVRIRCISDKKETGLVQQYQKQLLKDENSPYSKSNASAIQLISILYIQPTPSFNFCIASSTHIFFPVYHSSNLLNGYTEIITPPPQTA